MFSQQIQKYRNLEMKSVRNPPNIMKLKRCLAPSLMHLGIFRNEKVEKFTLQVVPSPPLY